jgi:hypothetical protein
MELLRRICNKRFAETAETAAPYIVEPMLPIELMVSTSSSAIYGGILVSYLSF